MTKQQKFWLFTVALISLCAFYLGIAHEAGGNLIGITWFFSPLGIFIWEDALVLGAFLFLGCVWLWHKNNPILAGLFFSAYAAIRSLIEALYALNAQFTTIVRPWEVAWRALPIVQKIGINEIFVFYQLLYTCIFVISGLVFISYARRYFKTN